MRLRNNPDAKSILEKSKYVIKKFPHKITDRTVIELGMGKGDMIAKLAKNNPDNIYIGIEKYATVAERCLRIIEEQKINNLFIINQDIQEFSDLLIGKVDTLWLTFSDPWPKARHEKRRLTHSSFLNLYKNILDQKSVVKFKTDNDKLFAYSIESFKENGFKILKKSTDFHREEFAKNNIMTDYEKKWSSKGKNINYLETKII